MNALFAVNVAKVACGFRSHNVNMCLQENKLKTINSQIALYILWSTID